MGAQALEVGEVRAILSLDQSGFTSGLQSAFGSIGAIASKFGPEGAAAAAVVIAGAFQVAFAAKLAQGVGVAIKDAFTSAAAYEQTKMAFKTLFGDEASTFYPTLQQFGVTSPFELKDLEGYTKRLKGVGFATEDIIPILEAAGDAAAALGDPSIVERVTYALGDMKTKGRVSAEEMSRQLASAGIPAWQMLADAIGVSVEEVRKLAEEGKITADVAIPAIVNGIKNSNMGGAMSDQMETVNGKMMMLTDSLELLKRDIGAPLVEAAQPFMDLAIDGLGRVSDIVSEFATTHGPELKRVWEEAQPAVMYLVEFGLDVMLRMLGDVLDAVAAIAPVFSVLVQTAAGAALLFESALLGFKTAIYKNIVMPLNTAIDAFNKLPGANIPGVRMSISGNTGAQSTIGGVRSFASGGIAVGPDTGYLAVLHGVERVTPIGQGGGGGQTINIYGSRADASAIAAEVRKVLRGEVGGALSRTALMGA